MDGDPSLSAWVALGVLAVVMAGGLLLKPDRVDSEPNPIYPQLVGLATEIREALFTVAFAGALVAFLSDPTVLNAAWWLSFALLAPVVLVVTWGPWIMLVWARLSGNRPEGRIAPSSVVAGLAAAAVLPPAAVLLTVLTGLDVRAGAAASLALAYLLWRLSYRHFRGHLRAAGYGRPPSGPTPRGGDRAPRPRHP
jgi:hypothetical protein